MQVDQWPLAVVSAAWALPPPLGGAATAKVLLRRMTLPEGARSQQEAGGVRGRRQRCFASERAATADVRSGRAGGPGGCGARANNTFFAAVRREEYPHAERRRENYSAVA